MTPMLAISLVQPMAWAIVNDSKVLENRVWAQLARGIAGLDRLPMRTARGPLQAGETLAIHASGKKPPADYIEMVLRASGRTELPPAAFMTSALVGTACVVDVVSAAPADQLEHIACFGPPGPNGIRADGWRRLCERYGDARAAELARWFTGPHALVLDQRRALEHPIPSVKGKLYLWEVGAEDERHIRKEIGAA